MKFLSEMIHKKRSAEEEGGADPLDDAFDDDDMAPAPRRVARREAAAPQAAAFSNDNDTVASFDDDDDDFDWDLDSIDLEGDDDAQPLRERAPRPATAVAAREKKHTTDTVKRVTALIDALDSEDEEDDDDLFMNLSSRLESRTEPQEDLRDEPRQPAKPRRPEPRSGDSRRPRNRADEDGFDDAPIPQSSLRDRRRPSRDADLDDMDGISAPRSRPLSRPVRAPEPEEADLYPEISQPRSRVRSEEDEDLYPEMSRSRSRPAPEPMDYDDEDDFEDLMSDGLMDDEEEEEDTAPLRLGAEMAAPEAPAEAPPVSRPTSQPAKAKIWDIEPDEDDAPLLPEPVRQQAAPPEPPAPVVEPAAPAPAAAAAPAARAGRVKTRLLGFGGFDETPNDPISAAAQAPKAASQFPVGWLVVIEGPGRGASFTLSGGASTIGRGEDQAVRLDFGDTSISREGHAVIAFDDEQTKFYIGHGGKANLVRLNGMPVLSTEALNNFDLVRIGETTLRFVALCGEDFSWNHSKEGQHAAE